jgi:hypothetical protein
MKRYVCLLSFALLFAAAVRADTVTVTATMTVGTEFLSGSVNWDTATNTLVVGSDHITAQGPLGPFTLFATAPGLSCTIPSGTTCGLPLVDWVDAAGDIFQIDPANENVLLPVFPAPGNYNSVLIDLFCQADGANPCALLSGGFDPGNEFEGTLTVTAAPEPTTNILLGVGLVGLVMLTGKRIGHRPAS